jgi:hypothetical protein
VTPAVAPATGEATCTILSDAICWIRRGDRHRCRVFLLAANGRQRHQRTGVSLPRVGTGDPCRHLCVSRVSGPRFRQYRAHYRRGLPAHPRTLPDPWTRAAPAARRVWQKLHLDRERESTWELDREACDRSSACHGVRPLVQA